MKTSTFTISIRTHFRQSDSAGILYFNEVNNIFHDAYEAFIAQNFMPAKEWFSNPEWAVPIVSLQTDFQKPLHPFEDYDVTILVEKLGTSSFRLATTITNSEKTHATVQSTHVFIEKKNGKSIEIPADISTQIKSLLTI